MCISSDLIPWRPRSWALVIRNLIQVSIIVIIMRMIMIIIIRMIIIIIIVTIIKIIIIIIIVIIIGATANNGLSTLW